VFLSPILLRHNWPRDVDAASATPLARSRDLSCVWLHDIERSIGLSIWQTAHKTGRKTINRNAREMTTRMVVIRKREIPTYVHRVAVFLPSNKAFCSNIPVTGYQTHMLSCIVLVGKVKKKTSLERREAVQRSTKSLSIITQNALTYSMLGRFQLAER